ncbi:sugar ABC transporter permease ['Fragaria x ananassa' phyllody phytoplasma]|uniref:Sugar ABC transporter permease n=1 Tax='Fragaria x ananassa' phyllody phytoplasma TaxID=2358428 RepID=A0ABS5K2Z2_9MOLU|nr:sugar ABC transporter permease ['Fragaria x ananassa' phyllody phytoplasma]MBS2126261.1 sugar ABC transporter permease ['Fragaria x ananassa' phyllody phytoplasma]
MSVSQKVRCNYLKYKHWYYLTPVLILLVIFNFFPLIKTIFVSLDSGYNKFSDVFSYSFSFKNYHKIFADPNFRKTLFNTCILVFTAVPFSIFLSFIIALVLNSVYQRFLKQFFQIVFFLPYLTNSVVMGMVFAFLFYHNIYSFKNSSEGLFNQMLGLEADWISAASSYSHKMFVLILYVVWRTLPFQILIFSVGFKNISKDYYDAACIDGASKITILKKITLPLLKPMIFYQLIITMIQVFKEYESVVGIFGPHESKVNTIVGYIYDQLSNPLTDAHAKAAAATIILLLISIFFTIVNFLLYPQKNKSKKY